MDPCVWVFIGKLQSNKGLFLSFSASSSLLGCPGYRGVVSKAVARTLSLMHTLWVKLPVTIIGVKSNRLVPRRPCRGQMWSNQRMVLRNSKSTISPWSGLEGSNPTAVKDFSFKSLLKCSHIVCIPSLYNYFMCEMKYLCNHLLCVWEMFWRRKESGVGPEYKFVRENRVTLSKSKRLPPSKKEKPLGLPDQWCWLWVTVTDSIWSNLPKGCFLRHTKRCKNISEACFKVQIVQLRKNYFLRPEVIQSSFLEQILGNTRALDNLATQPRKHWRKIQQIDSKFKFSKPPWTGFLNTPRVGAQYNPWRSTLCKSFKLDNLFNRSCLRGIILCEDKL